MISTATGVDVGVPGGDLAKRAGFVRIVLRKVLENAAAPPRGLSVIVREVRARIAELGARLPHTKRRMLEAALISIAAAATDEAIQLELFGGAASAAAAAKAAAAVAPAAARSVAQPAGGE